MRSARRIATISALFLAVAAAGVAMARTPHRPRQPTRHQIAVAVARAERSTALWATINICRAGRLGVRGEMPTLGFPASLWMQIQLRAWSRAQRRFVVLPAPAATVTLALGRQTTRLQQGGEVFPFAPHAGRLDATITFSWTRRGATIGRTVRTTTAGHPGAAFGTPPHFSAAACSLA